ncbi:MAG: hypothetical protein L0215_22800 [Gemmataceae bacterium]|nr:hypothetical protein [Gemmataceae bacterium]
MTLWRHTLIELWVWKQPARTLRDRRASPWDDPTRRSSHAVRRNALRRQCLEKEIHRDSISGGIQRKIARLWKRVVKLVA